MSDKGDRIQQLMQRLETGVQDVFSSDKYASYLKTMAQFHAYSPQNTMLVAMTRPNATMIAGFQKWKSLGRTVKKGEKGIPIFAPVPIKKELPRNNSLTEEKSAEISMLTFRVVHVFDVSQTEGRSLPRLAEDLVGTVEHDTLIADACKQASPVPISLEPMQGKDGYFHPAQQRIAICEGMSEAQTICAMVHEMAHAVLHSDITQKSSATQEVEAESVAFAVCAYYGVATDANSLGYIAGWSADKSVHTLRQSLDTIQRTVSDMITQIDAIYETRVNERYHVQLLEGDDIAEIADAYHACGFYNQAQSADIKREAADIAQKVNDVLFDKRLLQKDDALLEDAQEDAIENALQDCLLGKMLAVCERHSTWHTLPAEELPLGKIAYLTPAGDAFNTCEFYHVMDFKYAAHDANRHNIAMQVTFYRVKNRYPMDSAYFQSMKNVKSIKVRNIAEKERSSLRSHMAELQAQMPSEGAHRVRKNQER